jgi:O-methyltransferase involved in polyketide biosynthesis
MDKLRALAILIIVAGIIYLFNPGAQVEILTNTGASSATDQNINTTPSIKSAPIKATAAEKEASHHKASESQEIPKFIQDSLESKRIPADRLVKKHHPDGSISIDLKGQYQHVPIAIKGKDGKPQIIERVITPIADSEDK